MRRESGSRLEMPEEENELFGLDSTPPMSLAASATGSGGAENRPGCCDDHL